MKKLATKLNIYGTPDEKTKQQMEEAMSLPVTVNGALMPDAHYGYGLPIGGVLATQDAIIPYAVGVDIACRVKLSILDIPVSELENIEKFKKAIESETRFGAGSCFEKNQTYDHEVLDQDGWDLIPVDKDIAVSQLGTSGGGNHFVDFGIVNYGDHKNKVAILTHSGSRGPGARTCEKYNKIAKEQHPEGGTLAWLDMNTTAGQDYWLAMNLMGDFASANHEAIHNRLSSYLNAEVLCEIENHHNFAWKENDLYVHRKGATPAQEGVLGIIPGTMKDTAYIVIGAGDKKSICSSAHGAGREMSRTQAKKTIDIDDWKNKLRREGVTVLGAGADELPEAYKSIHQVMADQNKLVQIAGTFQPKIVKMAGKM